MTATGISPSGTGVHQVDASYAGDTNYSSSVSPTVGLTAQSTSSSASITVSGADQGGDSSTLTIAFNGFTERGHYDATSSTNSVASAFAAMFSRDYLKFGLCASVSGKGNVIVLKLKSASFQPITITGPSTSFQMTPAGFP